MKDLEARVAKLPQWVQQVIRDLDRQRLILQRELNEARDNQTPSPFFTDKLIWMDDTKSPAASRQYFQTESITINHANVEMDIYLHEAGINVHFAGGRRLSGDCAIIPRASNAVLFQYVERRLGI